MSKRAFTLVELLVVVAIIVVLLALLVPSLNRAIGAAQKAHCMANLHGWGFAFAMYGQDHKGKVVQYEPPKVGTYPRGQMWWNRLSPYLGSPDFGKDFSRPEGLWAPLQCAAAKPQTDVYYGTAEQSWRWDLGSGPAGTATTMTPGGYTINSWLTTYYDVNYWVSKYSNAPGKTPLLGEGMWVDTFPMFDNNVGPARDIYYGTDDGDLLRMVIARHRRAINLVFLDGSVLNTPLGDLWVQHWYGNVKPNHNYTGDYFEKNYPGDF